MTRITATIALLLWGATALGASPAPTFSLKCPTEASHQKKGAITLLWDGENFTETPEFEKQKVWRIERSEMAAWKLENGEFFRADTAYPSARTFYLNAMPTAEDIKLNRRQLLNIHTLGDISLGSTTFFYSKAETIDGLLQYASTYSYAGCTSELGGTEGRRMPR